MSEQIHLSNGKLSRWLIGIAATVVAAILVAVILGTAEWRVDFGDRLTAMESWKLGVDRFHQGDRFTRDDGKALEARISAMERDLERLRAKSEELDRDLQRLERGR